MSTAAASTLRCAGYHGATRGDKAVDRMLEEQREAVDAYYAWEEEHTARYLKEPP